MLDDKFPIYNVATIVNAGRDSDYKKSVIRASSSLLRFLYANNLLIDLEPFDQDGNLKLDTIIRRGNLTDEGFELFRQEIVDGWSKYLDRSTVPNKYENISRLEKGLKKIRGE